MLSSILRWLPLAALVCHTPGAEPEKSVIQIVNFSQQPVWDAPWRFQPVRKEAGSGFVIAGQRILSNAHVVSWPRQILVRRYQDPRPYLARPLYIAHDCDLAVLEVEEERFFDGLEPLELGELPAVRSSVVTYGYPAGGEQISYTRGVVSRIEVQPYAHSGNRGFLAVQTDAAINPGNSGGPVIQDDKVVGVAFQGIPGLENTGFFIPPPVIKHVLKDVEDGVYDGYPHAGIRLTTLQSPAYRRHLGLPDNDLGARVDRINQIPTTQAVLQEEDVLLQVGPYAIANDGTMLYQGNRVSAVAAFQEVQHGESLKLKLWRRQKEIEVTLPMKVFTEDRVEGNLYELPRYFIYGGLVFTPLSRDYLRAAEAGRTGAGGEELVYELIYRRIESPETARPEPVVLATTLAHAVNANMTIRGRALVDKINGQRIEKLADVPRAFAGNAGEYDVIEYISANAMEAMHRATAREANAEILKTYGIANDRRL